MAVNENEYKRLKKQAEDARRARDMAAGQLEAAMDRLKDEYGCNTLEEAQALACELDREKLYADEAYDAAVEAFKAAWNTEAGG